MPVGVAVHADPETRVLFGEVVRRGAGGPRPVDDPDAIAGDQRPPGDADPEQLLIERLRADLDVVTARLDRGVTGRLGDLDLWSAPTPEGRHLEEDHALRRDSERADLVHDREAPGRPRGGALRFIALVEPGATPAVGGVGLPRRGLPQHLDELPLGPRRPGGGAGVRLGGRGAFGSTAAASPRGQRGERQQQWAPYRCARHARLRVKVRAKHSERQRPDASSGLGGSLPSGRHPDPGSEFSFRLEAFRPLHAPALLGVFPMGPTFGCVCRNELVFGQIDHREG
jgi:hypothetical protein